MRAVLALLAPALLLACGQPACPSVFCDERLLEIVRQSCLFPDSKTFTDTPLLRSEGEVREDLLSLGPAPNAAAVSAFLGRNFDWSACASASSASSSSPVNATPCASDGAGSDVEEWVPPDWAPVPASFEAVADPELRRWALDVHALWRLLGKRVAEDVRAHPDRHSLVAAPHPFIAPGGRFREFYYWDTYWIVRGLIVSRMHETALGMVRNMLWARRELGLVPNGARTYYATRSQPPLLALMVEDCCSALEAAGRPADAQGLLNESLPALLADYEWWMAEPRVVVVADRAGRNHTLNRYYAGSDRPRPEGYAQDVEVAREVPPEKRGALWREIATMAFSGLDFSSRWFEPGKGLASARATRIVPVDLNSIMHAVEQAMARITARCNRSDLSSLFASRALARATAINAVMWKSCGMWADYLIPREGDPTEDNQSECQFFPHSVMPLWSGAHKGFVDGKVVVAAVRKSGVLEYPGGVPSSTVESGQQWDFPNVWAPHQWFVVQSLEAAGDHEAARELAMKWILSASEGWAKHGAMFEKYDCRILGVPGGGGEYPNQAGFGWTNGVTLEFLVTYGSEPSDGRSTAFWLTIVLPVSIASFAMLLLASNARIRRTKPAGAPAAPGESTYLINSHTGDPVHSSH
eukprot:m51a1_g14650 putative trehalase isoform x1 (639) ;mRNA; r:102685-104965